MKKELQDACDKVLEQLRNMDKKNKSGSQTMEFEGEIELRCADAQAEDFIMHAWERFEAWKAEEEARRIEQERKDYHEQFAVDGRNWNEV